MVRTQCYIPSKLKDGYKVKSNVQEIYFLALDFDKGTPAIDEWKDIGEHLPYSWFLHTSISHQKPKMDKDKLIDPVDRYRVILPLSRPITLSEVDVIKKNFMERYPTLDGTCFDANRYFMVNPDAECFLRNYSNGSLDGLPIFLNPDEVLGIAAPEIERRDKASKKIQSKKDQKTFESNTWLILHDKTQKQVKQITQKEKIFCPFCIHDNAHRNNPDSANAFIDLNPAGTHFIFCSSEDKTYWEDSNRVNENICKLFWNTSVGAPSVIGYESTQDSSVYYVFKNDADFSNYCRQNNINPNIRDFLPRREIIFNPGLPGGLTDMYYNVFLETEYMKKDYSKLPRIPLEDVTERLKASAPVIHAVMQNLFDKDEYLMRFTNWISYILQERKKANTAWLISSEEQGVGKDLLFVRILQPLFGEKQSQLLNGKRIAAGFNSQDLNCFLRGYNEVFSANDNRGNISRKEWLKDAITSPKQTIEFKGKDTFQADNFMNFILYSNNEIPVALDKNDRRFNVIRNIKAKKINEMAFYKNKKQLEADIHHELSAFAEIIFTLDYDEELANSVVTTEAKNNIIKASADQLDEFTEALKNKNPDYFLLEEVFPPNATEVMLGGKYTVSDVAKEVSDVIMRYGAIPSKYMGNIVKYHWNRSSFKEITTKLRMKGIEPKTVRINGDSLKAYKCNQCDQDVTSL